VGAQMGRRVVAHALPAAVVVVRVHVLGVLFFFSSRRRHTRLVSDWSSDVCSSDLVRSLEATMEGDSPGTAGKDVVGTTIILPMRSEERRVGKECRCRRSPEN